MQFLMDGVVKAMGYTEMSGVSLWNSALIMIVAFKITHIEPSNFRTASNAFEESFQFIG